MSVLSLRTFTACAHRRTCLTTAVAAAVLMGAGVVQAATPINVAQGKPATSPNVPCSLGALPGKAVDGKAANIYTDKWCAQGILGGATLTVDLACCATRTAHTRSHDEVGRQTVDSRRPPGFVKRAGDASSVPSAVDDA